MFIDIQHLQALEEQRLISCQKHPTEELLIWNYTPVCQFHKENWNEITRMCRGLITETSGKILYRPFPKFFNVSEHSGDDCLLPPLNWKQEFTCTKKMDGSLGILYWVEGGPYIATRGSFTSDQAVKGTKMLEKYSVREVPGLTFLFEVLYPENRIVLDYGDREDLVLLEVIETETGNALPLGEVAQLGEEFGTPVVEWVEMTQESLEVCPSVENEEGYVLRFSDGTRAKVKFSEYCRLHKLITGVSAKSIWENLKFGTPMDELLERVPDEFYGWVQGMKRRLTDAFFDIEQEAKGILEKGKKEWNQKEWAEYFLRPESSRLSGVLFVMLKEKDYSQHIWKMLKPEYSKPFHNDIDA